LVDLEQPTVHLETKRTSLLRFFAIRWMCFVNQRIFICCFSYYCFYRTCFALYSLEDSRYRRNDAGFVRNSPNIERLSGMINKAFLGLYKHFRQRILASKDRHLVENPSESGGLED